MSLYEHVSVNTLDQTKPVSERLCNPKYKPVRPDDVGKKPKSNRSITMHNVIYGWCSSIISHFYTKVLQTSHRTFQEIGTRWMSEITTWLMFPLALFIRKTHLSKFWHHLTIIKPSAVQLNRFNQAGITESNDKMCKYNTFTCEKL